MLRIQWHNNLRICVCLYLADAQLWIETEGAVEYLQSYIVRNSLFPPTVSIDMKPTAQDVPTREVPFETTLADKIIEKYNELIESFESKYSGESSLLTSSLPASTDQTNSLTDEDGVEDEEDAEEGDEDDCSGEESAWMFYVVIWSLNPLHIVLFW